MSQIAQLSEAEIEDRFQIRGPRAVAFTLAGYAKAATGFAVHFGEDLFMTTLLAVLPERKVLIFDCSGAETMNRKLLASGHGSFVGRPEGIHVQFKASRITETIYGGSRAFATPLPEFIVRLQRRESFRIETPRVRPLVFFGRLPDGSLLECAAHDISVNGIGLIAPQPPADLPAGEHLPRCHFHLPEEAHELFCAASLRHVTELESRTGQRQWRLGLQFDALPAADEQRIQRYIVRIERERRELS